MSQKLKPLSPKKLKFAINLAIWLVSCFVILAYRSATIGTSLLEPMSKDDKAALSKLIDPTLIWSLLGGCAILFLIASFIGYKFGTANTSERVRAILDQVSIETGSVLQNNGSLLVAVAYFTGEGMYFLGGFAAWVGWWFFEPKPLQQDVSAGEIASNGASA